MIGEFDLVFTGRRDRTETGEICAKNGRRLAIDSRSPLGGNGMPIVEDPINLNERKGVAQVCMSKLDLEPIPALVDDMQDTANNAYDAWPDRLFLIGRDGRVAYHGGRGPFGFSPDELESAIKAELDQ